MKFLQKKIDWVSGKGLLPSLVIGEEKISRKFFRSWIFVIIITCISACSSTRLIYTLAKEFIQDEITYFFNLNDEDRVLMNQKVSEMIAWHRKSMLPTYAAYLTNIADKIKAGQFSYTEINKITTNGGFLIEKTVNGLTPFASKFLIQHQEVKSIEFMELKMMKRQQERINELSIPEDDLFEDRLDRLTSGFERFFGTLSNEQVILLEAYTRETLYDKKVRFNNRTQLQRVFIKFLKTKPTEEALTIYLNKLILRGYEITNSTHKDFMKASLVRFQRLLVNMLEISSQKQRDKTINKILIYAEDFKSFSK